MASVRGGEELNFADRADFSKKMKEIATVVGRAIDDVEISAYFNRLTEYPLDLVCKAFDRALDNRDHEDIYLATLIPTDGEIRKAISAILEEEGGPDATIGCEKCKGTGFIMGERKDGSVFAERCECLLATIELRKKYRPKDQKKEG